ncbi:MAG: hypothetical protein BRD29_01355, partial [Bacteroidetes bacterium QH_2_67_10]
THRLMRPLAAFVVKDLKRLSERDVVQTVAAWEEEDDPPAASSVELPVFREGFGLWEHQKYFVDPGQPPGLGILLERLRPQGSA